VAKLKLNSDRLIQLPLVDTKENSLSGFWRWVELLAADDYVGALEALYWPEPPMWTPEKLKHFIATFWGGDKAWSVVVPNERLVGAINNLAEFQPVDTEDRGWLLAHVPITNEPADPKNDNIPLNGLASSFFVRPLQGCYVLEHEIFHL
jgi:hypothetical protein